MRNCYPHTSAPNPGCGIKPLCPEIDAIAKGSFKIKKLPKIVGSGSVVQSLEAALWAFYHAEDFKEGAILAVNLGNDADTTGAVYGQLPGAYFGEPGIPAAWRQQPAYRKLISNCGRELYLHFSKEIIVP